MLLSIKIKNVAYATFFMFQITPAPSTLQLLRQTFS